MDIEKIQKQIENADTMQIDLLMDMVFERKRQMFPEWDICYIALPKGDWEQRKRTLCELLALEQKARRRAGRKNT